LSRTVEKLNFELGVSHVVATPLTWIFEFGIWNLGRGSFLTSLPVSPKGKKPEEFRFWFFWVWNLGFEI